MVRSSNSPNTQPPLMLVQKPRPITARRPCRDVSPIEALPLETMVKLLNYMNVNDRVCLALTSTSIMRGANMHADSDFLDEDNDHCDEGEDHELLGHEDLMYRLSECVPRNLGYCYHCLTYVPMSYFGPKTGDLEYLACMDCRYYSTVPQPPHC